jgi:hypothetical protein
VAISVEGHGDRGVAHLRLNDLRWEAAMDAPRGVKMPEGVHAGIFDAAVGLDWAGINPRTMMFPLLWNPPLALGNTRSSSPLGQASFHSRSVFATTGPKRISRLPAAVFGTSSVLNLSARCTTLSLCPLRSTLFQVKARSSETRRPVKVATSWYTGGDLAVAGNDHQP